MYMAPRHVLLTAGFLAGGSGLMRAQPGPDYPVRPVPFTAVRVEDPFWSPRLETNRHVTIPYAFRRCEETGRIDNFAKAARLMPGPFRGIRYDDSDVFKVIEGAAYALALEPDPELDRYLDELIAKIAGAQEEDGYLYTARTIDPENLPPLCGPTRWSYLAQSHELYNLGHLYEAAVAHHLATGKRTLLDVALKSAALVTREFGPHARHDVPGHQEIEIGLCKLYRLTGHEGYLRLAHFFLDQRGRPEGHPLYGEYSQDHRPVTEQDRPVGHAVRAAYMYCGMADVAALTGDPAFARAIDRIWDNMVGRRMYITGGIGARHGGEAFGDDYELPNASAYAETCAAIANALWNHRMFLWHGDGKYIDVLERVLYNGFLAGVALEGDRFFYVNPLAAYGNARRQPWFDCACCPTNVARFMPSIPGYVYAVRDDSVYINLFVSSVARVSVAGQTVTFRQQTKYPWDGLVRITVEPETPADFCVRVRVPGWARGAPVPSDLYRYMDDQCEPVRVTVNGQPWIGELDRGYAPLIRRWQRGDRIELELPLAVRRVAAHSAVQACVGRVALERGPIVYCVEAVDNQGHVHDLVLPADSPLTAEHRPDLLGGVTVLRGPAQVVRQDENGTRRMTECELVAVPYYAWGHRAPGAMAVWLAARPDVARPTPLPTLATKARCSASHVHDDLSALNDGFEPESSGDLGVPRFTWWDHKGTTEWVQYDFGSPVTVRQVEVYWFDDRDAGRCRVPASWRVLYRRGDEWQPVAQPSGYGVARDTFNTTSFVPVETDALRLEVTLQKDCSGGILEWRVR